MDLLATVRKEGSRGGRGDFQWSDVQTSSHRENYLGHSLMAPVGRWQKGRDLNWYAKGDGDNKVDGESQEDPAARAARERKEEIRKVKEAEEDALARALGLPVPERNNPNMEQLGTQREVGKLLKEAADGQNPVPSRGVGYGHASTASGAGPVTDRIQGTEMTDVQVEAQVENTTDIDIMVEIVNTEVDPGTMTGTRIAIGGENTEITDPEHHRTAEKDASTVQHLQPRDVILIGRGMVEGADHPTPVAAITRTVTKAGGDTVRDAEISHD